MLEVEKIAWSDRCNLKKNIIIAQGSDLHVWRNRLSPEIHKIMNKSIFLLNDPLFNYL